MNDPCWLHQSGLLYHGHVIQQNPETLATIFQSDDGCAYVCTPAQLIFDRGVARQLCISYCEYWVRMERSLAEGDPPLPGEEE